MPCVCSSGRFALFLRNLVKAIRNIRSGVGLPRLPRERGSGLLPLLAIAYVPGAEVAVFSLSLSVLCSHVLHDQAKRLAVVTTGLLMLENHKVHALRCIKASKCRWRTEWHSTGGSGKTGTEYTYTLSAFLPAAGLL